VHTLGATVTLSFPTAAASATLEVQLPNGEPATVDEPERIDTDLVTHYDPPVPGRYTYRCIDSDGRAWQDVFNVRPGRSLALCSLAGAKKHLNMDDQQHVDDEELRGQIEAATTVIERHRLEIVAARQLTARVAGGRLLPRRPVIRAVSAARVDGGAPVDVTGWEVDAETDMLTVPRTAGAALTVTYYAGYEVVPEPFIRAAEIIAAHLWEAQRMSSIGGASSVGEDQYLTPSGLGYAIPNRAVQLLGGRPPVMA
jgi:hypothetical protein